MAKNKGGRPSVFTPEVVRKLEYAYGIDCTDEEACLYADVSESAFYDFLKETPQFAERRKALKNKPVLLGRQTVIKGFVGAAAEFDKRGNQLKAEIPPNPELAMKYLERKKKDEFSTRSEHLVVPKDDFDGMSDDDINQEADELQKRIDNAKTRTSTDEGGDRPAGKGKKKNKAEPA